MMIESVFGNMHFDTGWKCAIDITLFGKIYLIVVKARAYFEKDGITAEQENAFADFARKEAPLLHLTENALQSFAGESALSRYTPRTLLFERDGSYALLFDDSDNPDDGIAFVLAPTQKILSQDEYL